MIVFISTLYTSTIKDLIIPYDYLVFVAIFISLIAFRDDSKIKADIESSQSPNTNNQKRQINLMIDLIIITISIMILSYLKISEQVDLQLHIERIQIFSFILYLTAVINLLSRNLAETILLSFCYILILCLPAGILTYIVHKITAYQNIIVNHATVFSASLGVVVAAQAGVKWVSKNK